MQVDAPPIELEGSTAGGTQLLRRNAEALHSCRLSCLQLPIWPFLPAKDYCNGHLTLALSHAYQHTDVQVAHETASKVCSTA